MTVQALFLCPHAAAKSVAAAALFHRDATAAGLSVEVSNGGTDPDTDVLPLVRARLEKDGLLVTGPPSHVTPSQMERADVIVNFGCEARELPSLARTTTPVREWTVPDFSADADVAFSSIEDHVKRLVIELHGGGG